MAYKELSFCCSLEMLSEVSIPASFHYIKGVVFWSVAGALPVLMEIDRINEVFTAFEAQQLQRHYQGSIRFAKCSQAADAANISREIGEQTDAVDFAIQVLLKAGMSSPALREIAQAGVDVEQAAYAEIASIVILLGPLDFLTVAHVAIDLSYLWGHWSLPILHVASFIFKMIFLLALCRSPPDERRFLLKVAAKFLALLGIVLVILCIYARVLGMNDPIFSWLPWLVISNVMLFFMVIFCILGIRGTAQLPFFGLCLVQFFFARGLKSFTACCRLKRSAEDIETSDSDTSVAIWCKVRWGQHRLQVLGR